MSELEKMIGLVSTVLEEMTLEAREMTVALMEVNIMAHQTFGLPMQTFNEIFEEVVNMFQGQCVFRLYDRLFMSVGDFKICLN